MHEAPETEHNQEQPVATGNLMESRTSHLDDLLNRKLEEAFHQETSSVLFHEVAKIACEHSPVDLAYAVFRLPLSARSVVYQNLPDNRSKVDFLVNTDKNTRTELFRTISDQEIVRVINEMPTDEAVSILEDLSDRRLRRVMDQIETQKGARIKQLLQHKRNTAGRLMTNEFFSFTMETRIGEVAELIRSNPGIEFTRIVFVVNSRGELQGCVPARNLIVNPAHLPLKQVMQPILYKISPEGTRDEVVDIVERYKVAALPVVDEEGHLLGVITYEDVVELIEDIADETIANMAGTAEEIIGYEPVKERVFARIPWLLVTIIGGFISAAALGFFSSLVGSLFTLVIFFVPMITGMSGNVGLQCSTVLVRSMAIGVLSAGGKAEAIVKEICTGLIIGMIFGALGGVLILAIHSLGISSFGEHALLIAGIVSVGLLVACLWSTFLGVFSPLLFARLGVDPAIASGPIVTAFNDIFSMVMYFLVAKLIASFFAIF